MEEIEKVFIEIALPFIDVIVTELQDRGLQDTPENRIALLEETKAEFQAKLGGSLLGTMMTAMFDWYIDQYKTQIAIFND